MKSGKGNIGHDAHLGGAIIGLLITAALRPTMVHHNLRVFLIVLGAAGLLLAYLWLNPLLLPVFSFGERPWRGRGRVPKLPPYKLEAMRVDAILEKIQQRGAESLTAEEKTLLEQVSGKYRRRAESKKPRSDLAI